MIDLFFNKKEFQYDIQVLVRNFFPLEKVNVIYHEDQSTDYYMKCDLNQACLFEYKVAPPYNKNLLKRMVYDTLTVFSKKQLPWGTLTGIRPTKIALQMFLNGCKDAEVRKSLKEEYYASEEKIDLCVSIAECEKNLICEMDKENGYSVYIGIPFCPTTCHYCSFPSYSLERFHGLVEDYVEALIKEIKSCAHVFSEKKLFSIYVGGGTPTSLTAEQLDRLLQVIRSELPFQDLKEFTVEAGRPDSITREKLMVLKKHGVTRISINPQTMKQQTLSLMGRKHSVEEVISAFGLARELGFDNINMDLIVGLPDESPQDFLHTLEKVKECNPDSITIHTLVIKRASKLREEKEDDQNQDDKKYLEEDEVIVMQKEGLKFAKENNYHPYYMYRQKNKAGVTKNTNQENIGYARSSKECYYNIFIMEERHTILAFGAGASSKFVVEKDVRMERVENVKSVEDYIHRIDEMIQRKQDFIKEEM